MKEIPGHTAKVSDGNKCAAVICWCDERDSLAEVQRFYTDGHLILREIRARSEHLTAFGHAKTDSALYLAFKYRVAPFNEVLATHLLTSISNT